MRGRLILFHFWQQRCGGLGWGWVGQYSFPMNEQKMLVFTLISCSDATAMEQSDKLICRDFRAKYNSARQPVVDKRKFCPEFRPIQFFWAERLAFLFSHVIWILRVVLEVHLLIIFKSANQNFRNFKRLKLQHNRLHYVFVFKVLTSSRTKSN